MVVCRRTLGIAGGFFTTAMAKCMFLAAVQALFVFGLSNAEGTRMPLSSVWAAAVSPVLPILAAVLAMDVWSEERRTSRIDMILSSPVRERDFVVGKFLGVWVQLSAMCLFSLVLALVSLKFFAPAPLAAFNFVRAAMALVAMMMHSALWAALGCMVSSFFRSSAASLSASLALMFVLPRGIWAAVLACSQHTRALFGEMPLDEAAIDFASGSVSTGMVASLMVLTVASLFVTSKHVAMLRYGGALVWRRTASGRLAIALALVLAGILLHLSWRTNCTVEIASGDINSGFSERTRDILAETDGSISVSLYMPRNSPGFRAASQFLRALRRESEALAGVKITIRNVDPRWDFGAAERLVRLGASENSLVVEKGSRNVILPIRTGYGERVLASTIRRLSLPIWRRGLYWSVGHAEATSSQYGPFGLSDIARDLAREGYINRSIDLASENTIPDDCAAIVVAGAQKDFARIELDRIDAYLRSGGRLLVMFSSSAPSAGVASLLPAWGLRPVNQNFAGARTLSGSDVIVSDFSDHVISESLKGNRVVFERPVAFVPSAAAESVYGADGIGFATLADVSGESVAAVVERGAGAGGDTAIRPTRIVAIGDASFVMNSQLAARANANRDFFLNCVAYLSGADPSGADGTESDVLKLSLDRASFVRLLLISAVGVNVALFALMAVLVAARRRA
jgi:ABC-type transport system involved in multi-copper enzyme maturation permease subunit